MILLILLFAMASAQDCYNADTNEYLIAPGCKEYTDIVLDNTGIPDGSVTQAQCVAMGATVVGAYGTRPSGCYARLGDEIVFNTGGINSCNDGSDGYCVKFDNSTRSQCADGYGASYTLNSSGTSDNSMTESECREYAELNGINQYYPNQKYPHRPHGCYRLGSEVIFNIHPAAYYKACNAGSASNAPEPQCIQKKCDRCLPGYGGNQCTLCHITEYNDVLSSISTACSKKVCPIGFGSPKLDSWNASHVDHESNDCVPCPEGEYSSSADEGQCGICSTAGAGQVVKSPCNATHNAVIETCVSGQTFANGTECSTCSPVPDGYILESNCTTTTDTDYTPCQPDQYADNQQECKPCSTAGASEIMKSECTLTSNADIELCLLGTYANGNVCSTCDKIQPGFETESLCTTSTNTKSQACGDNEYQAYEVNGTIQVDCVDDTNKILCDGIAGVGKDLDYKNKEAPSICKCNPGYGGPTCSLCPLDKYSLGENLDVCQSKSCTTEGTGIPVKSTWVASDVDASDDCVACASGKYANNNQCETCPSGKYSATKAKECKSCPSGFEAQTGDCKYVCDDKVYRLEGAGYTPAFDRDDEEPPTNFTSEYVTRDECEAYAIKAYGAYGGDNDQPSNPRGCYVFNNQDVHYNMGGTGECKDTHKCLKASCVSAGCMRSDHVNYDSSATHNEGCGACNAGYEKSYTLVTTGRPDDSVSLAECMQRDGWSGTVSRGDKPFGCYAYGAFVHYNLYDPPIECDESNKCIQSRCIECRDNEYALNETCTRCSDVHPGSETVTKCGGNNDVVTRKCEENAYQRDIVNGSINVLCTAFPDPEPLTSKTIYVMHSFQLTGLSLNETRDNEDKIRMSIAMALGRNKEDITILSISDAARRRRLLQSGVSVEYKVRMENQTSADSLVNSIKSSSFESVLVNSLSSNLGVDSLSVSLDTPDTVKEIIKGCMDENRENFNPVANDEDNRLYGCGDCTGSRVLIDKVCQTAPVNLLWLWIVIPVVVVGGSVGVWLACKKTPKESSKVAPMNVNYRRVRIDF